MDFWNDIKNFFTNNVWNIIEFFAILIIGFILIQILVRILRKIFTKSKMEKIAQNFILAIIKVLLYLVLVLILLSVMGVSITGVVTALSAAVLAIGMALKSNIANLANGIVIVSMKMFKEGDYIIVNGVEGCITKINFLFTTLTTYDNRRIMLPNSAIVENAVTNNGANPIRRIDIIFPVAYESDVLLVKKVVTDVMLSNGKVLTEPAPFCKLKTLGDSSLNFFATCWVDSPDYWEVYYYVMENVYNEFKRNGITVPYHQIEVRERKEKVIMPVIEEPLPERVEKERKPEEHFSLENTKIVQDIKKITKINKKDKKSKKKDKAEKADTEAQKQEQK